MPMKFITFGQDDIQTALKNWFPDEFSRFQSLPNQQQQPNMDHNQNPPTSSSSSLRSLSLSAGSPEYSSLLFTIPGSSPHFPPPPPPPQDNQPHLTPSSSPHHHNQVIQALAQVTSHNPFPAPETENDAIMRAILHVLSTNNPSSPSTSTSLNPHLHLHQNLPNDYMVHPDQTSAFKRYNAPPPPSIMGGSSDQHQQQQLRRRMSLFKRSLTFFRGLNYMRMRERIQTSRPTSTTQLHHMISERRRREKLNENFQALRSLLPPGTKVRKPNPHRE